MALFLGLVEHRCLFVRLSWLQQFTPCSVKMNKLFSVALQVQMLLEAQGKLHSSRQVETQTPRSTASIAVGTGESVR